MDIKDIVTIVIVVATFLFTCLIPTIIGFVCSARKARKAKKDAEAAKNEEEKQRAEAEYQKALNEIKSNAKHFVEDAEAAYKGIDAIVKSQGGSCGSAKKDTVMTKILRECIDRKITFDETYWDNEVEAIVKTTKCVNAK